MASPHRIALRGSSESLRLELSWYDGYEIEEFLVVYQLRVAPFGDLRPWDGGQFPGWWSAVAASSSTGDYRQDERRGLRTLPVVDIVSLHEITERNLGAVLALGVAPTQERFVGTVAGALEDAREIPEAKPWYRAVYADEEPVGFVMLSWNVTPEPPRIIGPWFLWKLLVDERHQGRGYGREAVRLVAEVVAANGAVELLTSCVVADDGPEPFYRHLGFARTGEYDENGEVILALKLKVPQSSSR